jgi:hypothetical protein
MPKGYPLVPREKKVPTCHPDRPYRCKGLCSECYNVKRYAEQGDKIRSARRQYHYDNREKSIAATKRWRDAHLLEQREKSKAQHKRLRAESPDTVREYNYRPRGWSVARYDLVFAEQDGRCAICGKTVEGHLHIDHDHETNQPRGLLCSNCNVGIGLLQDSSKVAEAAAAYLKRFGK